MEESIIAGSSRPQVDTQLPPVSQSTLPSVTTATSSHGTVLQPYIAMDPQGEPAPTDTNPPVQTTLNPACDDSTATATAVASVTATAAAPTIASKATVTTSSHPGALPASADSTAPKTPLLRALEALRDLEIKNEPRNARGLTRAECARERWRMSKNSAHQSSMTDAEWYDFAQNPDFRGATFRIPDFDAPSRDRHDEDYEVMVGPKLEVWVELQGMQGICGWILSSEGGKVVIPEPASPGGQMIGSESAVASTADLSLRSMRSYPYTIGRDDGSVRGHNTGSLILSRISSRLGTRDATSSRASILSGKANTPMDMFNAPDGSATPTSSVPPSSTATSIAGSPRVGYNPGQRRNSRSFKVWLKEKKNHYREMPRRVPYQSPVLSTGQKLSQRFMNYEPEPKGFVRKRRSV